MLSTKEFNSYVRRGPFVKLWVFRIQYRRKSMYVITPAVLTAFYFKKKHDKRAGLCVGNIIKNALLL